MEDKISVMYSEEEIDKRIRELGKQISEEYAGESIHMVCVLKGASTFACELAKRDMFLCLPRTSTVLLRLGLPNSSAPVQQYFTCIDIIKPRDQTAKRRLASARRTDNCHILPGIYL